MLTFFVEKSLSSGAFFSFFLLHTFKLVEGIPARAVTLT